MSPIIMQNQMQAVEETVKVEVGEVKVETAEIDNGSFGVAQITGGLAIKDDTDKGKDEIVLNRMKNEHNSDEVCSSKEVLRMHDEKIKLGKNLDCEELKVSEITGELIKNGNDANSEIVLNSTLEPKIHGSQHQHVKTADRDKLNMCTHCNATFRHKTNLDDHIIKNHPDSIASISSKLHECTYCIYKTTVKSNFTKHKLKHPETADSYKLDTCVHCGATFKSKQKLDEHTIKNHPNFIASISTKIHECIHCTYKTTRKDKFGRHMLKHPETVDSYKLSTCVHCNATYKTKKNLDDHIVRKHPDSIASISSKIHHCTYCTYKTTVKTRLTDHMLKHSQTADRFKLRCNHCDATFKRKPGLDDHIIRKHRHFIASVSSKIHECTHCMHKTTMKSNLAKHILKHHSSFLRGKIAMT